jgi:hypothetical protein
LTPIESISITASSCFDQQSFLDFCLRISFHLMINPFFI